MERFTTDSRHDAPTGPSTPPSARDVLDTVLQRLYALGLTVQSVATSLPGDERGARLNRVVETIDITIGDVRRHMEQTTAGGSTTGDASPAAGATP